MVFLMVIILWLNYLPSKLMHATKKMVGVMEEIPLLLTNMLSKLVVLNPKKSTHILLVGEELGCASSMLLKLLRKLKAIKCLLNQKTLSKLNSNMDQLVYVLQLVLSKPTIGEF